MKDSYNADGSILRGVRHSRMFLAGIQAKSGLDPRLKRSGVTLWESHLFTANAIFKEPLEVAGLA
jgi:hypothetical protein